MHSPPRLTTSAHSWLRVTEFHAIEPTTPFSLNPDYHSTISRTHIPINTQLQENHVVNGCCWLNHSGGDSTRKFIEIVRANPCIKVRRGIVGHKHC
jgi:hypothetical protein